MSAYAGDTSEETKAKIQELKVSLEEARDNLEETEYERYISDQKKLLDELYLEYEEILNQRLDNLDVLIADMIEEINADASMINATLIEKADSVGYTLTESMSTIWETNTGTITSVLTTYGQGIQDGILSAATTVNNALSNINTSMQGMVSKLNSVANQVSSYASTSSAYYSSEANTASTYSYTYTPTTTTPSTSDKDSSSKKSSGGGSGGSSGGGSSSSSGSSGKSSGKSSSSNKSGSTNDKTSDVVAGAIVGVSSGASIYSYAGDTNGSTQYYKNDPTYVVLDERSGYVKVRHVDAETGVTGWFKEKDVTLLNGYKSGAQNILSDEIAWTQEDGREFIIRPSDGAILTPLAKDDSVLKASASNNIWDMANNPSDFIKDNLKLDSVDAPTGQYGQNNYTQHLDKVVFNLPNVKNYEELLGSLQRDKNFERLILAMTLDQVAGKSSLAKGKAIR